MIHIQRKEGKVLARLIDGQVDFYNNIWTKDQDFADEFKHFDTEKDAYDYWGVEYESGD